ncbi:FtsB family cell division protein [Flavobacterium sp. JP2137]|uniref:FtsB family cell division protein n=1 Tax=Flavobacterium sp. JP2137 TaxID=3414510 RepID=UPI003D2FE709
MGEEIEKKKRKFPVPRLLRNRFFLVGLFFIIWMLFIDNYSFLEHRILNKITNDLENNKAYFQDEILRDQKAIKRLKNGEATEKYAREKYYMKRDNEDIYIIEFDSLTAAETP